MISKTNIEWADFVWNPITGCTRVSAGCDNCYAHDMAKRLRGMGKKQYQQPFSQVVCHEDMLDGPLKRKKPTTIFLCSMSDMFHDDVPLRFIDRILEVIAACPQHRFMVLTKRPENIESKIYEATKDNPCRELGGGDYLPNLAIGVSVENQEMAGKRIPLLFDPWFPASMKFISVEPMLGELWLPDEWLDKLGWVICGGETGKNFRPMDIEWATLLWRTCEHAGVPFFFKHMAGRKPTPIDLQIRQFPEWMEISQ